MSWKIMRFLGLVCLLLAISGCAAQTGNLGTTGNTPTISVDPSLLDPTCTTTDQDQYVYRPKRLQLVEPCMHVTGTLVEIESSPGTDGDIGMFVKLDGPYQSLLSEGSQVIHGYLMVEAVCQDVPPVIEAMRVCASDPDPFLGPFPQVGDHIWLEGRYVLDLGHNAWAELHPLYRWGKATP